MRQWISLQRKVYSYFCALRTFGDAAAFLTGPAWSAVRIAPCSEALFLQHFTSQTWSTSWVFISQHPVIAKLSEANAFFVCRKVAFTFNYVNSLFIRFGKNDFAQTWSSRWIFSQHCLISQWSKSSISYSGNSSLRFPAEDFQFIKYAKNGFSYFSRARVLPLCEILNFSPAKSVFLFLCSQNARLYASQF